MRNIIFIGMPGAGKTTISKIVGKKLNLPIIDLDEYIMEKNNMSISDMFAISERYFRERETEVCKDMKDVENHIISCGGGVILNPINMEYLKEKGDVFFIDRSVKNILSNIDHESRPLLKDDALRLYALYDSRIDLYQQYATYIVDNNGTLDKTVQTILDIIKQ